MKNKSGIPILAIGLTLVLAWIAVGCYIFFYPNAFNFNWARGELGDYVGGGLGGITIVFISYTVWLQIEQINSQRNEAFEAGIFRVFEALKPELEGLSVRVISKVFKAKLVQLDGDKFDVMLQKYLDGDRTVFLRAMQKTKYCNVIQSSNDQPLKDALKRFKNIMEILGNSLDENEKKTGDDFSQAMRSTEIFQAYRKCFLEVSNKAQD